MRLTVIFVLCLTLSCYVHLSAGDSRYFISSNKLQFGDFVHIGRKLLQRPVETLNACKKSAVYKKVCHKILKTFCHMEVDYIVSKCL